jgi:site-specific DNA-methyltransferase (adenine-specific)
MNKNWDKALPPIEAWRECFRVLKDGAFLFTMAIPRLDCLWRISRDLESIGFVLEFTPIFHTFASGFPKAMNVAKAIDKRLGVEREVVGNYKRDGSAYQKESPHNQLSNGKAIDGRTTSLIEKRLEEARTKGIDITVPTSDEAKRMDGSYGGFQPKPAVEVIIVAMKPLSEKTYVDQALKNGKGCTWLDPCRIPIGNEVIQAGTSKSIRNGNFNEHEGWSRPWKKNDPELFAKRCDEALERTNSLGRFPANLLCGSGIDVNIEALIEARRILNENSKY